ncbi:MAG: GerMN domain-containing protein, partial [Vicinamibacterales bacterium]
ASGRYGWRRICFVRSALMRRVALVMAAAAILALVIGSFLAWWLPRWLNASDVPPTTTAQSAPTVTERKIRARLFYVTEDGTQLAGLEREVPFAEGAENQARAILEEQFKPAPVPFANALPPTTTVRAVFLTDRQEAYVDLSGDAATQHTGGSLDELFSVYSVVNALTVNLPAIERVQILVDGKEVDSLAGHVDLRRPLPRNLTWVAAGDSPTPSASSSPVPLSLSGLSWYPRRAH